MMSARKPLKPWLRKLYKRSYIACGGLAVIKTYGISVPRGH